TKDFVEAQIYEIENKLLIPDQKNKVFDKEKFTSESDFVKFEILKKYGFNKNEEITKIFKAGNGSSFFSENFQLIIHRNELIITERNQPPTFEEEIVLMKHFDFSKKQMSLDLKNIIEDIEEINTSFGWDLDVEKIHFPLKLRKKEKGDLFYPTGFSGKKKVSKFFRDEKLSILAKQKIWLLTDSDNSVLGIIPLRQDRRYTRDEETKYVLQIFNEEKHEI
ncbi:tRNA lysidine(34) synthetase TilS, partial [Chryseobacterium sp.]|uniref:tRNA lysidine(34) synthetase TilS n=1 Tax=Chryseobacterium sp. TaxID=1871047 RepID=UPI0025BE4305